MKEWDRQRIHDKELTEQVTQQVEDASAKKSINRYHSLGLSVEAIKEALSEDYGFSDDHIDELLEEALPKPVSIK